MCAARSVSVRSTICCSGVFSERSGPRILCAAHTRSRTHTHIRRPTHAHMPASERWGKVGGAERDCVLISHMLYQMRVREVKFTLDVLYQPVRIFEIEVKMWPLL